MKKRKCVMLVVCLMALCGYGGVEEEPQNAPVVGEAAELPDEVTDVVPFIQGKGIVMQAGLN